MCILTSVFLLFSPCPVGDGKVSVCVAAGQAQPTTSSRNVTVWSDMENIKISFFMAKLYLDFIWMRGYKKFMTVIASKSWDPKIYWLFYRQSDNTGEGESNCPVDTAGFVFILTETWHKNFTFLLSNPRLLVIISFHQHHSFCLSSLSASPK